MSIQLTTLPNGLRVITDTVPEMDSVAVGVWCDVGTRNEDLAHNGVAHMVEHMMFNGTPTRSSQEIAETIENVGGQMNAYTSREMTAYYIHLLKEDLNLGLEILSDMLQRPTFPDKELEKERGVILQEIGMTNDTPDDVVFDYYQATAYPEQALGAPILGTANIVAGMSKQTLFDYVHRFYTPSKLIISAAGNLSHDNVVKQVQNLFTELPEDVNGNYDPARYVGGQIRTEKDLEQSHIVLGFQGVSRENPSYFAASLMAMIMGGGMSSRLFQEVREKRGLVYSVFSSHSSFHDDGQFEIYAGTGPDKLPELMPVLCDQIRKMESENVTDGELARAKAQIKAGILMGRESMMGRANRQAKYLLNFGKPLDVHSLIAQIDAVTPEEIRSVSQTIFTGTPTLSALGPLAQLEDFGETQKRLAA